MKELFENNPISVTSSPLKPFNDPRPLTNILALE
jgi:hypothetical protein